MKILTISIYLIGQSLSRFRTGTRLRSGSFLVFASLLCVGTYAVFDTNAHEGGITGYTQKSNNEGCYCHCSSQETSTTVAIASSSGTSPLTASPNTAYNFTVTVGNSTEYNGGVDVASYSGNGLSAGSDGLQLSGGELTHKSPKSFSGGSTSWSFTYTTGSSSAWDTLYATGNAVNGDGSNDNGNCDDKWNWSNKFIIHTVTPPMRMALSRTSVSLGDVRVGSRYADSLKVISNGTSAITINSSGMKSGASFSSYPTTSSRTINAGSSEIDSAIFSPTARGSFNDSLIFNTNSDTVPEQRMGLYVSGQGIQAVFNSTNGTSVAFGNLRVGETIQKTFYFSNSGDDTLFLQTPSVSGSGFSLVSESGLTFPPNQSGSVMLQFTPAAKQSYSGSLTFTASNGVSAPTISLNGTGTAPLFQATSPASLGSIHAGRTLEATVSFKNVGNDTLHISSVWLVQPSSRFSLGIYSETVLPNATGTVNISYQPNEAITDSATLHLSTDDVSDTGAAIAIYGSGILPHFEASNSASLGSTRVGLTLQGTVSFTNTGNDTLHVSNASITQSSNLFTAGSYSETVLPNSTGTIHITYTPNQEETDSASLNFTTDDPNDSSVTILITGSGELPHMEIAENRDTVDLGEIRINSIATSDIAVTNNGGVDLTISNAVVSPTPFSISAKPNIISAGTMGYVTVRFAPASTGTFTGMLIVTGDDEANSSDTVFLTGTGINSSLSIDPSSLAFGAVPVNTTVKDTIILNNTGSASVNILGYKITGSTKEFFIVDSSAKQVAAGGAANIIVSFRPDSTTAFSGALSLTTDDAETPIRTINISGHGTIGSLSVAPSPVDFGNLSIGHDSTISVTLKNTGQAGVTINSVSLSGSAEFSKGNFATPVTISAGDSTSLNVTFSPATGGSVTGSLSFTVGDGSAVNIALNGAGVSSGVANSVQSEFSLTLTPNPASSAVVARLTLTGESDGAIYILDEAGHNLLTIPLGILSEGEHDIAIPTLGLAHGSYFVQFRNSNGENAVARLVR